MSDQAPDALPKSATVEATLDGKAIRIPTERRSINAIRCYLETLALEQQRIIFTFVVESDQGRPPSVSGGNNPFTRVAAETVDLKDMPMHLLETALHQIADARLLIERAVSLVLINERPLARELWWNLTRKLKEPLLTLSLVPETTCRPTEGGATPLQLRRWQLQQLAVILKEVDEACWATEAATLSNALEMRVLPWLESLEELIRLWHGTVMAGLRAGRPLTFSPLPSPAPES